MMLTSDKYNCRFIAAALAHYGVRHAVVSPGSRNAPAIVAMARTPELECHSVIDERSAAFVGLGMALQTGEPVALLCTSGSAALNYAPALAEAYYRRVPLIAITADRPEEWIEQDDSQTIRQAHALDAVVRGSFNIPVCRGGDHGLRQICERRICDALMLAQGNIPGPVHINLQIDEPIDALSENPTDNFIFPERILPQSVPDSVFMDYCAQELSDARVLVLAGFMPPSTRLSGLLEALPQNFAVLCEKQSNLTGNFADNIDATLNSMTPEEKIDALPDIVITIGGALLSRMVKTYLRGAQISHWSIGAADGIVDPLLHLRKRIELAPESFFDALLHAFPAGTHAENYRAVWLSASARGRRKSQDCLLHACWSDFKAMGTLLSAVPPQTNLHLSNGTAVRYAQLFDCPGAVRTECNRGVSGIDGCTSTATGAAMLSENLTLLITGDMCAQYDMAALATNGIPPSLRIAVLNNSGGGIFRFIKSTRSLPEMESYLAGGVRLPLRELAAGFGFDYMEAENEDDLCAALPQFFSGRERPAILNIITPPQQSAETIKKYFNII